MTDVPAAEGFAMPAEWTEHERTIVAWPARAELWGDQLDGAKHAHAAVSRAIARFEPALVVANVGDGDEAHAACGEGQDHPIEVVEEPIDDSWIRDCGPIGVRDAQRRRAAIDFRFNGWGEKYRPYDADAEVAARLCDRLGLRRFDAPIVLEGGAITVDCAGTLVPTEQCLLHPGRNPMLGKEALEDALRTWLGVARVVWLAAGLVEDLDTDGHVDNVCTFIAPAVALVQGTSDAANPNAAILAGNRERLGAAGIETHVVEVLPYDSVAGRRVVVPPLNCYFVNGGMLVPVPDDDERATRAIVARFEELIPDREVVPVPTSVLAYGGGGIHCITQQVPA
jgi:agmatine deiminase